MTSTYTYDAANRLLVSHSPGHTVNYTWDARGNLIGEGAFTYDYNAAGRMVRADSVTGTVVYTYTAAGLRVAQRVNGDIMTFAWDWATGVPELLSDGGTLYLVGHETLGQFADDVWTYHLPDALGSVRHATDIQGVVTAAREWTPYAGEWFDADVEAQYLRARWHDVATGRFTSEDVWEGDYERPQSLNGWVYVEGNPVRLVDPSGYTWDEETKINILNYGIVSCRDKCSLAFEFASASVKHPKRRSTSSGVPR